MESIITVTTSVSCLLACSQQLFSSNYSLMLSASLSSSEDNSADAPSSQQPLILQHTSPQALSVPSGSFHPFYSFIPVTSFILLNLISSEKCFLSIPPHQKPLSVLFLLSTFFSPQGAMIGSNWNIWKEMYFDQTCDFLPWGLRKSHPNLSVFYFLNVRTKGGFISVLPGYLSDFWVSYIV